jgi:Matrixin
MSKVDSTFMTFTAFKLRSSNTMFFRNPQQVFCALFGISVLLGSTTAGAYCRTTTCNAILEGGCDIDARGCATKGSPLYWPDLCVSFGVHEDGSALRNISYKRARDVAEDAFQEWISADCGGGSRPFVGVSSKGKVFCDKLEYNHGGEPKEGEPPPNAQGPNANIIVFRDALWPYSEQDKTIALTTITFVKNTGEILDADIEVNSFGIELSTNDKNVTSDLQSILTHEVGHFFGLAHSDLEDATMNKNYDRKATTFRSLSDDDEAAICSVYPPQPGYEITDCTGEEPRFGFSRFCGSPDEATGGCGLGTTAPNSNSTGWGAALLGAALALGSRLRRRR